jgi:hypothetical protein
VHRLFGHHFWRATTGWTEVNGMPVFRCKCGAEWAPIKWLHRHNLTKRDTFAPWY